MAFSEHGPSQLDKKGYRVSKGEFKMRKEALV